jgi:4-aminobutyrate aminotransferase-like enzyme
MIAMELTGADESLSASSVFRELFENGFVVGCKPAANLLRFYPALVIDEEDTVQLVENLDRILGAVRHAA